MGNTASTPKLYGTNWCWLTNGFDNYFRTLGIKFDRFDVERDPNAEQAVKDMNSGKVKFPMVVIGDDRLKNPTIQELNKSLNKYDLL